MAADFFFFHVCLISFTGLQFRVKHPSNCAHVNEASEVN